MVFVLIQAAGSLHGLHVLQRFALTALAGISMSASGRRLLLNDATLAVPPLMDVLTSVTKRVIVLLCNESILGGFVKVTNLPYLEGSCYVTKPSTWKVGVT